MAVGTLIDRDGRKIAHLPQIICRPTSNSNTTFPASDRNRGALSVVIMPSLLDHYFSHANVDKRCCADLLRLQL